ncbi:MAG: neutral zinc metallopeptidase [Weeksellaceae bacterium]
MKWTNERGGNVEDRRGMSRRTVGGIGIGTLLIAAVIYFMGGDPRGILEQSQSQTVQTQERELSQQEKETGELVQMLDAWNTKTWEQIFMEKGAQYRPAKIVMFSEATQSGCGSAQTSMGPFYCPADETIYVDMSFFSQVLTRFGAETTQFAIAYVLAHENGHHVQHLMGTLGQQEQMRRSGRYSEEQLNQVSVAVELQADFYAGYWAKRNNERVQGGVLEPGDIESAVQAAAAVGDDNIQKRTQGYVNQEAFTHGTSKQRVDWFVKGYKASDINEGDTFNAVLR